MIDAGEHPLFPGVDDLRRGRSRRSRAPTPPCWSPSGRSSRASTGRGRRRHAPAAAHRRPQLHRPARGCRGRASSTRASASARPSRRRSQADRRGGRERGPRHPPAGRHPRRRRGHAPAARHVARAQARRAGGGAAVRRLHPRQPRAPRRGARRLLDGLPGRGHRGGDRRRRGLRLCGGATPSRTSRWARPARSPTAQARARRRQLLRVQRRRAERRRPDARWRALHAEKRRHGRRSSSRRSRTRGATAWSSCATTAAWPAFLEKPGEWQRRRRSSTPASTCSSPRSSR